MATIELTITTEPRDEVYRQLIDYASRICTHFLLVTRDGVGLSQQAVDTLSSMEQSLIERSITSEWPGTVLFGHTACVFKFAINPSTSDNLKTSVNGLFEWLQPDMPEDLCLIRGNVPWLTTISHERDAYISISDPVELLNIKKAIPGLLFADVEI
jgi:hypothetical protein